MVGPAPTSAPRAARSHYSTIDSSRHVVTLCESFAWCCRVWGQLRSPAADTARTITVTRMSNGATVADGASYWPGESLKLTLSNSAGQYLWEVSSDSLAGATGTSCSYAR